MDWPRPTVHIQKFTKQWGFEHVASSPRYAQSKVLEKDHPISMAWMVPRWEQVGPSTTAIPKHPITQSWTRSNPKLYGRPIQDTLPAHRRAFSPEWQHSTSTAEEQAQTTMENVVRSYNSKVRPLPEIKIKSYSSTEPWNKTVGHLQNCHRHRPKDAEWQVLVRNRRFLCCCIPPSIPTLTTNISPTHDLERPRRSTRVRKKKQKKNDWSKKLASLASMSKTTKKLQWGEM